MKAKVFTDEELATEEWRAIPSLLGSYEASSLGRLRSLDRRRLHYDPRWDCWINRFYHGRILATRLHENGSGQVYCQVRTDGAIYLYAHRLICEAWHGPAPSPHHDAAHGDGDGLNNRPSNLTWKTKAENAADKILHGTDNRGSKNHASVLTEDDIPKIFSMYLTASCLEEVADAYGIQQSTVHFILRRKMWRHVNIPEHVVQAAERRSKLNNATSNDRKGNGYAVRKAARDQIRSGKQA